MWTTSPKADQACMLLRPPPPVKNIRTLENVKREEEKGERMQRWDTVGRTAWCFSKTGEWSWSRHGGTELAFGGHLLRPQLCKLDLTGSSWQPGTDVAGISCHIPLASDFTGSCNGPVCSGPGSPCSKRPTFSTLQFFLLPPWEHAHLSASHCKRLNTTRHILRPMGTLPPVLPVDSSGSCCLDFPGGPGSKTLVMTLLTLLPIFPPSHFQYQGSTPT